MIYVENLSFSYGKLKVLENISLSFDSYGFYGIVGPNGAGKTTLLKLLCQLLDSDSGNIYWKNGKKQSMAKWSRNKIAKNIAYVPQQFLVDYDFVVIDVVKMGRHPYHGRFEGFSSQEMRMVEEAMELTGITHLKDKSITQLSGGELQRVMIARALVQDTPVILLDEPISHLDIHYQKEIVLLLQKIAHQKEKIVITVLHDINVAMNYCDYIHLICEGGAISGEPSEVLTKERIESVYKTDVNMVSDKDKQLVYW